MLISTTNPLDEMSVGSNHTEPREMATQPGDQVPSDDNLILEAASFTNERHGHDWSMVTDDYETKSMDGFNYESSGVLIVPGEDENPIVNLAAIESRPEENGADSDDMNLSVPGSDSLPTIVDSLELLGRDQTTPTESAANQEGTLVNSPGVDNAGQKNQDGAIPGRSREWFGPRNFSYIVGTTVMACFASMAVSYVLVREERNSLLESVARLEQEVLDLKEEAVKRENEATLNWDSCDTAHETTLVDNCWLSAKANVKLGECGNTFAERLEQLSKPSWTETEDNPLIDHFTQLIKKMNQSSKTIWNGSVEEARKLRESIDSGAHSSSLLSSMDFVGQYLWKSTVNEVKEATTTFFNFFSSEREGSTATEPGNHTTEGVEDILHGFTELFAFASSFSVAAGEALIAATTEKAIEALDFNESLKYLMDAVEEASLAHGIDA